MKKVKLAEIILSLESGSRPKGGADINGTIPSIGAEHLDGKGGFNFTKLKKISKDYFKEMSKGRISKGQILVVKDGATTGKTSIVNDEFPFIAAAINEHVFSLNINTNIALPKFIYYHLSSPIGQNQILSDFRGATVGGISRGFIEKVTFNLPSIPEQNIIVEKLDLASNLCKYDEKLLEKYDELIQSVFFAMFGDPVKNNMKWPTCRFDEIGSLDRGVSKHRPRNAPELLNGIYPLIQTGNVANSNGVIDSYSATYSENGLKQSKLWPKGTLCITIAANIAKTGILNFEACFPDSIVGFIPNQKSNVVYVQFWLACWQKILEDTAPESAQKNINLEILRKLKVALPPIHLQNKFERIYISIKKQKELTNKSIIKSSELFQSLTQNIVS